MRVIVFTDPRCILDALSVPCKGHASSCAFMSVYLLCKEKKDRILVNRNPQESVNLARSIHPPFPRSRPTVTPTCLYFPPVCLNMIKPPREMLTINDPIGRFRCENSRVSKDLQGGNFGSESKDGSGDEELMSARE